MTQLLPIADGKTTWKLIGIALRKHPRLLAFVLLLFVLSSLIALVTPWQIGRVIDRATAGQLTAFPWEELAWIAAATLANAIVTRTWIFQGQNLGTRINKDLSVELIGSAMELDAQTVEDAGSGDLVSRITDDLDSIRQIITAGLPEIIHVIITMATIIGAIFFLSPALGLMTVPFVIAEVGIISYFLPRIAQQTTERTRRVSTMTTVASENAQGAATAAELGISDARTRQLHAAINDYFSVAEALVKLRARLWAFDSLSSFSPFFLAVAWGSICVLNGWATWGHVSTAAILTFNMRTNADIFSYWLDRLREMTVTMGRVTGVIDLARTQLNRRTQHRLTTPEPGDGGPAVDVNNVSFSYTPDTPVLTGINLTLQPGESVALVGRSGSGKTTLARLIAGSLTATEGTITVENHPVGHGQYPTHRGDDGRPLLLICTQEAHTFFGTLAENLTVVKPTATPQDMWQALDAVGATWARDLDHGLDSNLTDESLHLTRDHIQHIALARVVLANPHVVILDESTTQLELLDATEALRPIFAHRTVIIISHDARIASLADRAVLLADGRLTAEGTPQEIFQLTNRTTD